MYKKENQASVSFVKSSLRVHIQECKEWTPLQRGVECPSGRVVKAMPCYCKVVAAKALGFTCAGSNPVCDAFFGQFLLDW